MGPPSPGSVNGVTVLSVACLLILPALWIYARRAGSRRGRIGWLAAVLTLLFLAMGATALAYPPAMLLLRNSPDLKHHPEAWAWTAASPAVAFALAWWFGRDFPGTGGWRLVRRAATLFGACFATVLWGILAGLPVFTMQGIGPLVALATTMVCVIAWQLTDRLRPAQLLVRAAVLLAVCGLVDWVAHRSGVRGVMASPRGASRTGVLVTLVLIALAALAVSLAGVAVWRLVEGRWWPRGWWAPGRRRPKPGEIWNADVPFDQDETESKDRPVLVVRVSGGDAEIMKITSQDKSRFDHYLHLPLSEWRGVLAKDSWLDLNAMSLPVENFRSYRGKCRPDVWRQVSAGVPADA